MDERILHRVTDAETRNETVLDVEFDYHGMSITAPNGQMIVLDADDGKLNIHLAQYGNDVSMKIGHLNLEDKGDEKSYSDIARDGRFE